MSFFVFPRFQCVYTHQVGRTTMLQQNWHFKEKTHYLMNTLYLASNFVTPAWVPHREVFGYIYSFSIESCSYYRHQTEGQKDRQKNKMIDRTERKTYRKRRCTMCRYRAFVRLLPGVSPHVNNQHVLRLERLLLPRYQKCTVSALCTADRGVIILGWGWGGKTLRCWQMYCECTWKKTRLSAEVASRLTICIIFTCYNLATGKWSSSCWHGCGRSLYAEINHSSFIIYDSWQLTLLRPCLCVFFPLW